MRVQTERYKHNVRGCTESITDMSGPSFQRLGVKAWLVHLGRENISRMKQKGDGACIIHEPLQILAGQAILPAQAWLIYLLQHAQLRHRYQDIRTGAALNINGAVLLDIGRFGHQDHHVQRLQQDVSATRGLFGLGGCYGITPAWKYSEAHNVGFRLFESNAISHLPRHVASNQAFIHGHIMFKSYNH